MTVPIALALFGIWIINRAASTPDFGEQVPGDSLTNQGQFNPTTLSDMQGDDGTWIVFHKQQAEL